MKERTDGMIYAGNLTEEHIGKQFIVMNKADADFSKGTVVTVDHTDMVYPFASSSQCTQVVLLDDVLLLPVEGLDITAPTVDAEPDDFSINELTEQYVQIDLNEVAALIAVGETVYCDEGKHAIDHLTPFSNIQFCSDGYIADNVGEFLFDTDFYKKVTA